MSEIDKQIPKKRGRKPKNKKVVINNNIIKKNSEEEPLVAHLDLKFDDFAQKSDEMDSKAIDSRQSNEDNDGFDSLFLKNDDTNALHCTSDMKTLESDGVYSDTMRSIDDSSKMNLSKVSDSIDFDSMLNKITSKSVDNLSIDDSSKMNLPLDYYISEIEKKIYNLKFQLYKLTKSTNIEVVRSKYDTDTKCWWCKNEFDSDYVSLPETYFNDKFHCYGCFCSYNCAHAFNLDTNDNFWKKKSLLHLLYLKTYGKPIDLIAAPHWTCLKEFGGSLSIDEFRENSIINTKEYLMLKPPIESRLNFFEKTYNNKTKELGSLNSIYQKILDDSDDLVIKRSKPLKSSQFSLDKTLFIKKKERMKKMNDVDSVLSSI